MEVCGALLAFIIGVVSGIAQVWLLSRFTNAVSCGKINIKVVFIAIFQLFLPLIVLVCCALLLSQNLLWMGIGMVSSLIVCACARFFVALRR